MAILFNKYPFLLGRPDVMPTITMTTMPNVSSVFIFANNDRSVFSVGEKKETVLWYTNIGVSVGCCNCSYDVAKPVHCSLNSDAFRAVPLKYQSARADQAVMFFRQQCVKWLVTSVRGKPTVNRRSYAAGKPRLRESKSINVGPYSRWCLYRMGIIRHRTGILIWKHHAEAFAQRRGTTDDDGITVGKEE